MNLAKTPVDLNTTILLILRCRLKRPIDWQNLPARRLITSEKARTVLPKLSVTIRYEAISQLDCCNTWLSGNYADWTSLLAGVCGGSMPAMPTLQVANTLWTTQNFQTADAVHTGRLRRHTQRWAKVLSFPDRTA